MKVEIDMGHMGWRLEPNDKDDHPFFERESHGHLKINAINFEFDWYYSSIKFEVYHFLVKSIEIGGDKLPSYMIGREDYKTIIAWLEKQTSGDLFEQWKASVADARILKNMFCDYDK